MGPLPLRVKTAAGVRQLASRPDQLSRSHFQDKKLFGGTVVHLQDMAKAAGIEGKLDTLTTLVEKGFAAVADDILSIKERMATKADVAELRLELHTFRTESEGSFRALRRELTDINKRLDLIEQNYANLKGVTNEIDEIRAEVRAIQKHLGIERKIAA